MNSGYAIQCSSTQPHPAQAKCLASLAPAGADVHDPRAHFPGRAQLRAAPCVVEDHDLGPPRLEQLDDGGRVKCGRGVQ